MNDRLQEAIRLVLETEGLEGIDKLRDALGSVGDVSAETVGDTERLIDSLNELNDIAGKAKRYGELSSELERTERALDQASNAAYQLTLQLGATDKPSRELVKAQKLAREEVDRLKGSVDKQWQALQRADDELGKLGFNTTDLAKSQAELRNSVGRTTTAIVEQVDVVRKQSDAQRQLRERLAAGDAEFRKFAQSGRVSADALAAYRARAASAAEETKRLKGSVGEAGGAFGKLRSVMAGVATYFGFREAARGVGNLLKVASASEDARRSLQNLYGSQAEGNRAFDQLQGIAKTNGLAFQSLVDNAKKLKAFGLDPLNGSLQSLIDQNAAVGGSQEDLSGKVLALGQAWAKQKLQGEEILQLVERGVPVWSLLEKATGKNVQELQKLSEQGKLGRDVIKKLYEEIGRANTGAAQNGLSSLSGLMQQVSARWNDFLIRVADNGVTDYFKRQIQSLLGSTQNLDGVAKRVANGIISVVDGVRSFAVQMAPVGKVVAGITQFLATHAGTLAQVAKAYLALMVVRTVTPLFGTFRAMLASIGPVAESTGGKLGSLQRTLKGIPTDIRIAFALVGYEVLLSATAEITNQLTKNSEAVRAAGVAQREMREEMYQGAVAFRAVAVANSQYRDTVLKTAEEVAQSTDAERNAYAERLAGLLSYQKAQAKFLIGFKAIGVATKDQITELDGLRTGLESTRKAQDELSKAIESGAGKARTAAQLYADAAGVGFDQLIAKGETAREAVGSIFDNLDLTKPAQLENALAAFDEIANKSDQAAEAVRAQLRAELSNLSEEDLPRVRGAAEYIFGKNGREMVGAFAEAIKSINLKRLGVDLEEIRTGLSSGARAAIEQFRAATREVKTLGLTAEQQSRAVAQSFKGAFKDISSAQELQEIEKALREAASAGVINTAEYNAAVGDVKSKLTELQQVGQQAGQEVAAGMAEAEQSVRNVQTATEDASASMESMGQSGADAGAAAANGVNDAAGAASSLSYTISGASDEFARLLLVQDNLSLGNAFRAQQVELAKAVAEAKRLNGEFDEIAGRREDLQKKFNLVDPQKVDELVQAEKQLEDSRKRRADEEKRRADEEKRRTDESLKKAQQAQAEAQRQEAARAQAGLQEVQVIRLEIVAADGVSALLSNGGRLDPVTARRLAESLASPILQVIGRARDGSNQPKRYTR